MNRSKLKGYAAAHNTSFKIEEGGGAGDYQTNYGQNRQINH